MNDVTIFRPRTIINFTIERVFIETKLQSNSFNEKMMVGRILMVTA